MTNSFRYAPLSAEKSCALFRQLAQLEKAGFHADKAFALIAYTDKSLTAGLYAYAKLYKTVPLLTKPHFHHSVILQLLNGA